MRINISGGLIETTPNKKVLESIGDHIDHPNPNPATPRFAATVMLVRDSKTNPTKYQITDGEMPGEFPTGQEIEVFMLRRVKSMAFVPDAVVFPGGRVDDRDSNPSLPWVGPTPTQWAEYMSVTEDIARRVVVAAAREVFEECGVLLAGPSEDSLVNDLSDPTYQDDRAALVAHELSFADMLIKRGLVLRTDLLGLVSNWCTPEFEPKRYDTFFFSALMPEGQKADDKTSESQISDWVTPAYAIRESDRGHWLVVPPTVYNLTSIASSPSAEEFVSSRRKLQKIMFHPSRKENGEIVLQCQLDKAK